LRLDVLRHCAAVLNEKDRLSHPRCVMLVRAKDGEQLPQELFIGLKEIDNIDLVKEYKRIEHGEGRIVQYACQNNVLEVEKPVCVVDFPADVVVFDFDDLFEL
jgi:hypothetical protein